MAKIDEHALVEFHNGREATVYWESSSPSEQQHRLGEINLFCLFTFRQLVNLGVGSAFSSRLAVQLRAMSVEGEGVPPDLPLLVGSKPVKGKKRFSTISSST